VLYSHPVYRIWSHFPHACERSWRLRVHWKAWTTKRPRQFSWSRELKYIVRTLSEVVLFSCVVILSTPWRTFPQVCRETWTLLLNVGRLLWACCIDVDAVARRGPSTTIPGVSWSFNGSGRVVSCEQGCWTRTRRHNSSSRYLSSYADKVRLCRPTPEARDSSLTSGWRPGNSRCRLLAADPLALPFLVLFPSFFRLTLIGLNWLYVCSGHYIKRTVRIVIVWRLNA